MLTHALRAALVAALVSTVHMELFPEERPRTVRLDALVQEVLEHNQELKRYEREVTAAKGELVAAGSWENPEIETSLGRKELHERDGGLAGEGAAWSVAVAQTFEYPGRIALRKAIANGQLRLAQLAVQQFRQALAAKARLMGFELLGKQELAKAARQVSARAQELMSTLLQREPAGVAPLLEMRIIQASVLALRREALEAEKEAQSALFALNQLQGSPLSTVVEIAPTEIKLPRLPNPGWLVARAATDNLELQMQQVELESQGFKVALSKNERWPSIKVAPFYEEERAGEKEHTVGVSLSLPLPVWHQNSGNIAASRAREEQAQAALALTQRRVEQEVREKATAYELLLAEMARWSPKIADELREAALLGDKHYRLGALPVATYVEIQEGYLSSLKIINQTRAEALAAVQQLELMTGAALLEVREVTSPSRGEEK